MKTLEMYTPKDPGYEAVCQFAQEVYTSEISLKISKFPDVLFAITEGGQIAGCMGLNTSLRFPLFLNDPRLKRIMRESGKGTRYCEQSVLAIKNYSIGLPILISVVANFAYNVGMQRVVYAAIEVSQRTIRSLGFNATTYGEAVLDMLPPSMRPTYVTWHRKHSPVCCFLDTREAPLICEDVLRRFEKRIQLGYRLEQRFSVLCT